MRLGIDSNRDSPNGVYGTGVVRISFYSLDKLFLWFRVLGVIVRGDD